MELADVQAVRGLCYSIKIKKTKLISPTEPARDENGNIIYFEEEPNIILTFDNEHSIEEDHHPLIWDDEHQLVIGFRSNSQTPNGVMMGRDRVETPAAMYICNYAQIQHIQVVLNEEAFNKYCEVLIDPAKYAAAVGNTKVWKVQDQFKDEQYKNAYNLLFNATNPSATIPIKLKPPQQTFSGMYEDKYGILNK